MKQQQGVITMRKLKTILLLSSLTIMLSFALTGCADDDKADKTTNGSTSAASEFIDNVSEDIRDGASEVKDKLEDSTRK